MRQGRGETLSQGFRRGELLIGRGREMLLNQTCAERLALRVFASEKLEDSGEQIGLGANQGQHLVGDD